EYRDRIGSVSAATTVPRIEEFIRMGGTVIAEGSSTNLGYHLGLPIKNHLVEEVEGGVEQPLRSQKYFVPGSVLEVKLEHVSPVTHGLGERVDVLFSRSPVLRLPADADRQGVRRIGWFDTPEPLRSGWAWGQHYLENGSVLLEAAIGEGKVFLFTPRVTFRAQSHGTFPLVFNAIYYGTAEPSADGNRIVNR
ncbi:MAG: peptidase, partial [Candidatus Latescibacteria bacterium]|nr:peptidase [Candidatus Latescibacterota bacterium]